MGLLHVKLLILLLVVSNQCEAQVDSGFVNLHKIAGRNFTVFNTKIDLYSDHTTGKKDKSSTGLAYWESRIRPLLHKNNAEPLTKIVHDNHAGFNPLLDKGYEGKTVGENHKTKYSSSGDTLTPGFTNVERQHEKITNSLVKPIGDIVGLQSLDIGMNVSNNLPGISNMDSLIEAKFQVLSTSVISNIKGSITSTLSNIKKNGQLLPGMSKIESKALESIKKFKMDAALFSSEATGWETVSGKNIFLQNNMSADVTAIGIPVSATALYVVNFHDLGNNKRLTYKINYNRNDFLEKLGVNKTDLKARMQEQLDFKKQINYKDMISKSFSNVPEINSIIGSTGCKWEHLLEMPMSEFQKRYNKDMLKSKLVDAQKLKDYYNDYAKKYKDSVILNKVNQADSLMDKLKKESALYDNLVTIKKQAEKLYEKVQALKKLYDEKAKALLEGYNVVKDLARNSKDLSGLQKFMLKVKGMNIGQHTLSTGNLVLQNYLQNGVSFEYETDRAYLLITKGSQQRMETPGNYFQQNANTQNGVSEYYQFNNRYNLTGMSLGRGNMERNAQQVSLMNFRKLDNGQQPSLFAKTVNVFTVSNRFVSVGGQKLSIDISKSSVAEQKNINGNNYQGNSYSNDFAGTLAAEVKYEFVSKLTQEMQKFKFSYSGKAYNNPGLNGGIARPGIQFDHGLNRKLTKRISADNQFSYYSFRYGNSVSLKGLRDRINVSYKLKKMRIGVLLNGSYLNQLQYDPKFILKTRSLDVLATGQTRQRFGNFLVNMNAGLGYGFNQQQLFNKVKNWSFYANTGISFKGFMLSIDIDRFNTRNTEIFSTDSTIMVLVSSFNLQSTLAYSSKKGDLFQLGVLYKVLDNNASQFFISGDVEWRLFKRFSIAGNMNLPLASPTNTFFMNNTFNSKLIYNIKGHE